MLKDWPRSRLSWWSCLTDEEKIFGIELQTHGAQIPNRLYPQHRLVFIKNLLLQNIWAPWATRDLHATIARTKPDVIWTIPHQWAIPPLHRMLAEGRAGYHTTIQDYPNGIRSLRRFGPARCHRWMQQLDSLYASSTTRDATSHAMADDLFERTTKTADQILHAGLEATDFLRWHEVRESQDKIVRIAYAGTIMAENAFNLFVSVLQKLRAEDDLPIELHFFSAHSYAARAWFDPGWMKERGNLPEEKLRKELHACSWGFSPMDLDDNDPQYNRYSFPTKFIAYLAAGLPVLTLGHPKCSVIQMAQTYRVGICLTSTQADELKDNLRAAFRISNPHAQFQEEITRCARTEFNAEQMRQRLYESFERCRSFTRAKKSTA
jgi:hypothetical protein